LWDRADRNGWRLLGVSHFDREYLLSSRNIQAARWRNKKGETKFCFAFSRTRIFYLSVIAPIVIVIIPVARFLFRAEQ